MSSDNERVRDNDNDDDRGGRFSRPSRGGSGPSGGGRGGSGGSGGRSRRRRQNSYCPEGKCFDYKDVETLRRMLTETGKIKPRRQTGNCARCQRELAREVKRARHLALLPFIINTD